MFVRRSLMVFALALSVARCAEQPTAVQHPPAPATPQFLAWANGISPQFTSTAIHPSLSGGAAQMTPPLSLDNYTVSFWAVRGESRSIRINYVSPIDSTVHPFMSLTTTDPQFVPGVGDLAMGDSVLITVSVDTDKVGVRLEPTGLVFGEPAQLKLWYGGAAGDLNGDGVVDASDASLEAQLLGLWYREGQSDPWTELSANQSLDEQSFTYSLPHFCEYAIALLDLAISW